MVKVLHVLSLFTSALHAVLLIPSNGLRLPAPTDGVGENGIDNFCVDGKLLPKFFLLGAPKCATTSFSMELGRFGGVREAPRLWSPKEWHFWERFPVGANAEAARQSFFDQLGECPTSKLLLADYSINNLAAVPAPAGTTLSPCTCEEIGGEQEKQWKGGDVPRLLKAAYGNYSDNITMMVMLREPLARAQSAWYHARSENFAGYWGFTDCCTESFSAAMSHVAEANRGSGDLQHHIGGEGNLWPSMYGTQLEAYLEYFDASHFIVVPYRQYTGGEHTVCSLVAERLHTAMNCSDSNGFEENVHEHLPVDEDIPQETRWELQSLLEPEIERLVSVLVRMHDNGATLANFEGAAGNASAVRQWLESSW